MGIEIITPPAKEPIDVGFVKSHLRVDWSDDDTYIASLITMARQWMEQKIRRALMTQTLRYTCSITPPPPDRLVVIPSMKTLIEIPMPPTSSITTVQIGSQIGTWATLTATTHYLSELTLTPAVLVLLPEAFDHGNGTLAPDRWRVRITYQAGYGASETNVPMSLRVAIARVVAYLYEHRADPHIPDSFIPSEYKVWRL
jgi:uncharacterized phiE125 gp8 family phage protein